jgi:hypothetical protein
MRSRDDMPKSAINTSVPDADNPEWTKEKFARAKRFDELPESLRNKLSAIQEASRKRRGLLVDETAAAGVCEAAQGVNATQHKRGTTAKGKCGEMIITLAQARLEELAGAQESISPGLKPDS